MWIRCGRQKVVARMDSQELAMVRQQERNPKWPGSSMRMSIQKTTFHSSLPLNLINVFKRCWAEMVFKTPLCLLDASVLVMQVINDSLCTYTHLEKSPKIRQSELFVTMVPPI